MPHHRSLGRNQLWLPVHRKASPTGLTFWLTRSHTWNPVLAHYSLWKPSLSVSGLVERNIFSLNRGSTLHFKGGHFQSHNAPLYAIQGQCFRAINLPQSDGQSLCQELMPFGGLDVTEMWACPRRTPPGLGPYFCIGPLLGQCLTHGWDFTHP